MGKSPNSQLANQLELSGIIPSNVQNIMDLASYLYGIVGLLNINMQ